MTELFKEKAFLDLIQELLDCHTVGRKATYIIEYRDVTVTLYSEPNTISEHNIMIWHNRTITYINQVQLNQYKFNLKLTEELK